VTEKRGKKADEIICISKLRKTGCVREKSKSKSKKVLKEKKSDKS